MVKKGITREEAKKELTCKRCKKIGHLREDCKVKLEKDKSETDNDKDIGDNNNNNINFLNSYTAAEISSDDEDDTNNFFKKPSYNFLAKPFKLKPVNNLSDCSDSNSKVSSDSHYSIDDVGNQKESLNGHHV